MERTSETGIDVVTTDPTHSECPAREQTEDKTLPEVEMASEAEDVG